MFLSFGPLEKPGGGGEGCLGEWRERKLGEYVQVNRPDRIMGVGRMTNKVCV